jgi:nucleolar GTP-binding protein
MARTLKKKEEGPPPVSQAQRLLDIAFKRATAVTPSGKTKLERSRSLTTRKIGRASGVLLRHLSMARAPFRHPEDLPPFTKVLLDVRLGPGKVERSIGRIRVAEERIVRFRTDEERQIPRLKDPDLLRESLKRFYGRASSVVREVEEDLVRLDRAAYLLKHRPRIDPSTPTVVVAGFPNVGKSSLVKCITGASPKIAPYPFTTVTVSLGHAEIGPTLKAQLVDTPGLLLRAPKAPSAISEAESEAEAALAASNGIVLYLMDPTETCGWSMADQRRLLASLKERYPARQIIVVENKVDLMRSESEYPKISCTTGEGLEALVESLDKELSRDSVTGEERRSLRFGRARPPPP